MHTEESKTRHKNPNKNCYVITKFLSEFYQSFSEIRIPYRPKRQSYKHLSFLKPKCEEMLDTQKASFKRLLILDISADRDTCLAELKTVCFLFS